jgi:hypothetical protein
VRALAANPIALLSPTIEVANIGVMRQRLRKWEKADF